MLLISLSMDKFELVATVENLSDVVEVTSLDLVNGGDVFSAVTNDITFNTDTNASLILSHDDHGNLLNLQIEDLNALENASQSSSNIFGMLNGDHYAVDENFVLATYFDFGDKTLDTNAFEAYRSGHWVPLHE